MKKFFLDFHLWLSVPFGIIVTLICFSGAMLVFEPEVVKVLRRDLLYVDSPRHAALPVDKLVRNVERTLPPGVTVTGVTMFADPELACKVNLSKPRRAAVYVDQYTGEIKGRYERPAFFDTMLRLHRWLLGKRDDNGGVFWGRVVVGISTIAFVLVLISGVVAWWPKTRRALRNSLKIFTSKGSHRLWQSLHVAGGMYVLLILLVMALTGLTWSFSWYSKGFYALFGVSEVPRSGAQIYAEQAARAAGNDRHGRAHGEEGGTEKGRRGGRHGEMEQRQARRGGEMKPDGGHGAGREGGAMSGNSALACAKWQDVYDNLKVRNTEYKQITVSDGKAEVSFGGLGNQRAADRYEFDAATGRITSASLYADSDRASKVRGWIFSVHMGTWGGLLTRLLWFVVALFGATLPLTGYYLWIRRLRRRAR